MNLWVFRGNVSLRDTCNYDAYGNNYTCIMSNYYGVINENCYVLYSIPLQKDYYCSSDVSVTAGWFLFSLGGFIISMLIIIKICMFMNEISRSDNTINSLPI